MIISVSEAARILEKRGALSRRRKNQADWVVDFVAGLIGRPTPADLDVSRATDHAAVYFFDHDSGFESPNYAAGSSIGTFLLLLAEHDAAMEEKRPQGWELAIDPDLDKCPRAPPIWRAG
jgi:hypothetical protein